MALQYPKKGLKILLGSCTFLVILLILEGFLSENEKIVSRESHESNETDFILKTKSIDSQIINRKIASNELQQNENHLKGLNMSLEKMEIRKAPEFTLPDENGVSRTLSSFLEKGPLVVVFYPGDFTPTCTKQLCSYRDGFEEYKNLGIQIVGISNDSAEKHLKFKEKYKFQFPLLTDAKKEVAKSFGATSKWLLGAVTRANFIVNQKGEIIFEHIDGVPVTHQKNEDLKSVIEALKKDNKL